MLLVFLCLLLCLTYHTHGQSANRFRQALLALIRLSNNRPTTTTQRPIRTVQSLPSSLSNSTLPRLTTNDLLAMREEFRVLFQNNVSLKDVLTKELFQTPNLAIWYITFRILYYVENNVPNIFARHLVRTLEQVFESAYRWWQNMFVCKGDLNLHLLIFRTEELVKDVVELVQNQNVTFDNITPSLGYKILSGKYKPV